SPPELVLSSPPPQPATSTASAARSERVARSLGIWIGRSIPAWKRRSGHPMRCAARSAALFPAACQSCGPAMATLHQELTEIPLERLRRRRSAKWAMYPEALPAWVAEMDFPLAPPVKRALVEAIELDDCGYAAPAELGLAE